MSDETAPQTPASEGQELTAPLRRLLPPSSSFDFSNGVFERSRNTRVLNTVLAGVVLAALLVVLGSGLRSSFASGSSDNDVEAAQVTLTEAAADLKVAVSQRLGAEPPGSLTTSAMRSRISNFSSALAAVGATDIDATRLVDSAAQASSVSGAQLTGLDIVPAADGSASRSGGSDIQVVITATTTGNVSTLEAWKSAVQGLGWITLGEESFDFAPGAGTAPSTLTATGTLVPDVARSASASELVRRFATPETTPTTVPSTSVPNSPFGPVPSFTVPPPPGEN